MTFLDYYDQNPSGVFTPSRVQMAYVGNGHENIKHKTPFRFL